MKHNNIQMLVEQVALLIASFIWTTIILTAITFFWAYQDVQTRWEYVINAPPQALAQSLPTDTASPTPTVWAGPPPTLTPTPTLPPSPTPTRVVPMPEILPETLNPDDPTPVPVMVHTQQEATEFGVDSNTQQSGPITIGIQATPTPANTQTEPPPPPPAVAAPAIGDTAGETPAVANGIPTHLTIPSVGIDSEIIPVGWSVIEKDGQEYSIWQVADFAVGWHKTTAALGQPGNTVMAGHHNVNGEVFKDLVNVEVGDSVAIYSGGQRFEYEVELKTIVKEKGEPADVRRRNAQWIAPTDDERVTFVTCWPYTNNTHRVIVVAKPVS